MLAVTLFAAVATLVGGVTTSAISADRAATRPGALTVAFSFDTTRGIPVEGAISYVSIARDRGTLLTAELNGLYDERSITVPAKPGHYRVRTYQRFCNGNCGNLSDPVYECERSVRLKRGDRVRARVPIVFGPESQTCRIRVSR